MKPVRMTTLTLICACATGVAGTAQARETPDNSASAAPVAARWEAKPIRGMDAVNAVLMRAISLVGTPYVWGGTTPDGGFDCSGLVNYVFQDMLNVKLPRTSRELAAIQGPRIDFEALQPGDLVFFGSNGVVSHVGIYVGERRFIHAPRTGTVVRLEQIDKSYWTGRYTGARRVIAL